MASTPPLKTRALTSGQVATRVQSLDFAWLGQLLPNPDPILKAAGKDLRTYRELSRSGHVGACIRRRKSAVKALQYGLDRGQAPARVAKAISDMLAKLNMEALIGHAVDAALYGYQPFEIDWATGADGPFAGIWAGDVVALPPEWFTFDVDAALRFKTRQAPLYGELLPERKFVLARQDATYANPYGQPDLALCYWPDVFLRGGKRFWFSFAEKYGSAFAVGKLPRSADPAERTAMLNDLEALVQNGVASIPDDGSVEIIEAAGKGASADLYERLVLFCRGEISIALTGTNQTVEATANKASAAAGMDVADDLRDGDAEIVAAAVNQVIRWAVDINWPGAPAPTWAMWDQKAKDSLQAARDKSNYEAGARYSKSYWVRAYGYQDDDLVDTAAQVPVPPATAGTGAVAFAQAAVAAAAVPTDPMAAATAQLSQAAQPVWNDLVAQLQALVDQASDSATLQRALVQAYGNLPTEQLTQLMAAAFALAQLQGMAAAQGNAGDQAGA